MNRFEQELQQTNLIIDYSFSRLDQHRSYLYLNTEPHPTEWQLFTLVSQEPLIPVFPFPYHSDGSITINIIGPLVQLQTVVESIPAGLKTTIERVGDFDLGQGPIPPSLPARQRESLSTALKLGYFDTPRTATRDEVADRMDCAPSTASEHIRKAEHHVIQTFLNQAT